MLDSRPAQSRENAGTGSQAGVLNSAGIAAVRHPLQKPLHPALIQAFGIWLPLAVRPEGKDLSDHY